MRLKQSLSPAAWPAVAFERRGLAILMLGTMLALSACEPGRGPQLTAEAEEPHYRRGLQMLRSNNHQFALEAFLKVIDKRSGDAPESHLEAGQIYLQNRKDPIPAIYHFSRHLELRPNGPQAALVRGQIETAKKDFARSLPGNPLEQQVGRLDLLDQLEKLQGENATLRAEVAQLRQGTPVAPVGNVAAVVRPPQTDPRAAVAQQPVRNADLGQPVVPVTVPQRPQEPVASSPRRDGGARPAGVLSPPTAPAAGRTYVVQAGDNLFKISARFYGSGGRWPAILEANRDQLRSERDLKIGMVLRLP